MEKLQKRNTYKKRSNWQGLEEDWLLQGENKRLCRESRFTMRGTLMQTAGGGPGGRFSPCGVAFGSLRVRRLVVNRTVE